jgi:acyl-CoA thioesterase YciA
MPALRTVAMPADTNPAGDIFGGHIMAMMDLAAGLSATTVANGRVVTASVSRLSFLAPVQVGDAISCYTELLRRGRTSMAFAVEVWVRRQRLGEEVKVTEAEFIMVAVDSMGRPRPLPGVAEASAVPPAPSDPASPTT